MIILKIYSILLILLIIGVALKSKHVPDKGAITTSIMFTPVLIYLLFGGVV